MSIQFPLYISTSSNSGDQYYDDDSLLLHADGVAGAGNNYFVDASTNTSVITRVGTPTQGSVNPFGSNWSAYFDGGSTSTVYASTVTTSSLAFGANNWTIEAWVNAASTVSNYPLIIGNYVTTFTTNAWGLYYNRIDTGNFYFSASNGGMTLASGSAYVVNGWNHVAVSRNGATVILFVNGTQTASYNYGATSLDGGVAANLYIGDAGGNDATTRFRGYISNVRVVNGSAVYTAAFTPPTAPLSTVTNTALLTLASNYVKDLSTNTFATTASTGVSIQRFNPFGNTQTYAISSATIQGSTYFDGSTGYLLGSTNSLLSLSGDFTIEMWINGSATRGVYPVILARNAAYTSANNVYLCYRHTSAPNVFSLQRNPSSPLLSGTTTLTDGVWYHFALVRSGTTVKMYVNGNQETNTLTDSNTYDYSTPVIGSNPSDGGATVAQLAFGGYISNFRIIKGTALYTSNFTPSSIPLTTVTNTVLLTNQYSNSLADVSTASNVITATGVAAPSLRSPFTRVDTSTAATIYGGSMYFNGSTDYLSIPYNSAFNFSTNNLTIECWFYCNLSATQTLYAFNYNQANNGYAAVRLVITGSAFYMLLSTDGSTWINSNTFGSYNSNAWNHVAIVRNGSTFTLYSNGIAQGTQSTASALYNASGNFSYIGQELGGGQFFSGYISNLRVVNGQALYTGTFTVSTVALTTSSQGATGTQLLLQGTNAGIYDSTMENNAIALGTAQLSTQQYEFGGGSVYFTGTSYLSMPYSTAVNLSITQAWTVECWFYAYTVSVLGPIITKDWSAGTTNPSYAIFLNGTSGQLQFMFGNGTSGAYSQQYIYSGITTSTWYHAAMTRSGSNVYCFVNGSLVQTIAITGVMVDAGNQLRIGSNQNTSGYFWGYIDDVRITNTVARYTATFTPPTQAFTNIQLITATIVNSSFTTATNIGTVSWGYNTATTRWSGLQEPTAPTNLTPASIEDQVNTSTGYFSLPQGTTGQRPATPQAGYMRYNTTLDSVEYYNAVTGWTAIP